MAVEKQMTPFEIEGQEDSEALEIEIVNPEAVSIETEDGGMVIDFEGGITDSLVGPGHDANLAEFIDDDELKIIHTAFQSLITQALAIMGKDNGKQKHTTTLGIHPNGAANSCSKK